MELQEKAWTSNNGLVWRLTTGSYSALIYPAQQFAGRWTAWVYGPNDEADMIVLTTQEHARQWCERRLMYLGAPWSPPKNAPRS